MLKKRVFDIMLCGITLPLWVPTCLLTGLLIAVTEGRPIFYRSIRRVYLKDSHPVVKFRTMVRDAEAIANRDTVPISTGRRFLNIPTDSVLYTRVGRWIERLNLTEIPQFVHVLSGRMSVVGNRPLPENVISSLGEVYGNVEERFRSRCGLTGPVQLIGRDKLTDEDRLSLEAAYCRWALERYSLRTDIKILFYTVLVGSHLMQAKSIDELMAWFDPPGAS